MKRLIIAAAFVPLLAHADSWELPNQSGGKQYKNLKAMFAVSSTGKTITGCWYYSDGWVHVIYNDNTEYKYPASSFSFIKTGGSGSNI